ncbi:MAG: hypothetical protein MUE30_19375 [Spirosomaceae bacterium]|jgi:hypothetical protein|nr:hypothetical protein [Spirosomataceae bacterium]
MTLVYAYKALGQECRIKTEVFGGQENLPVGQYDSCVVAVSFEPHDVSAIRRWMLPRKMVSVLVGV